MEYYQTDVLFSIVVFLSACAFFYEALKYRENRTGIKPYDQIRDTERIRRWRKNSKIW